MLLAVFQAVGCKESEPEVAPEALLSADKLVFAQSASQKSVTVTFVGEGFSVSSAESSAQWCSAEVKTDAIVVDVDENGTEELRTAVITVAFSSEELPAQSITVMQESGSVPYLKTTASETFEFGSRGGTYKFSVSASREWKAELVDCSWAGLSYDASSVTVTAPANEGNAVLSGKVRVSSGDQSVEYPFTQETAASDKYLSLLGEYDVYSDKWYTVTQYNSYSRKGMCGALGASGTLTELWTSPTSNMYSTRAKITEDKYGVSYYIEDLFIKGQKLPVVVNRETGKLEIPTLWNTGTVLIYYSSYSPAENMPAFFVRYTINESDISMKYSSYDAETMTATVSEDGRTITLDTAQTHEEGAGIADGSGVTLVYMNMGLTSPVLTPFEKIYMPYGNTMELRRIVESN